MALKRLVRIKRDCVAFGRLVRKSYRLYPHVFTLSLIALVVFWIASILLVPGTALSHTHTHVSQVGDQSSDVDSFVSIASLYAKSSVGILFPLIIASCTVVGFLIGLAKLEELAGQVTSLPAFLDRAAELIEESIINGDDVSIVCHSPFIGNLSAREQRMQQRFRKALESAAKSGVVRLKILGLEPDALGHYYMAFGEDKRYAAIKCEDAFSEMGDFLTSMTLYERQYFGLPYEHLPEFFMATNGFRAVVASPLFLPARDEVLSDHGTDGQSDGATSGGNRKVDLIGFATRDGGTIAELIEAMEFGCKRATIVHRDGGIDAAISEWTPKISAAREANRVP